MLKHTKKIKEMYEDIQRRIFYMIPEKFDSVYLYSSVMDRIDGKKQENYFSIIYLKVFLRKIL